MKKSIATVLAEQLTEKSPNGTTFEVLREYKAAGHSLTYAVRVTRDGHSMMFPTGSILRTARTLAMLDDVVFRMGAFTDFRK